MDSRVDNRVDNFGITAGVIAPDVAGSRPRNGV